VIFKNRKILFSRKENSKVLLEPLCLSCISLYPLLSLNISSYPCVSLCDLYTPSHACITLCWCIPPCSQYNACEKLPRPCVLLLWCGWCFSLRGDIKLCMALLWLAGVFHHTPGESLERAHEPVFRACTLWGAGIIALWCVFQCVKVYLYAVSS